MITRSLICAALVLASGAHAAGYQVVFDTAECNGDTGFGSVDLRHVYRIDTIDCGPNYPATRRKQVIVYTPTTGFDVFTVTERASEAIRQQIRAYVGARRRAIEERGTLTVEKR